MIDLRRLSAPLVVSAALLASACQASGASTANPSAVAGSPSPSSSVASPAAAVTLRPTTPPLPLAVPRPTDIPVDGTCEDGHTCLGLLGLGTHHTSVFSPGFAFSLAGPGWENLADGGGDFALLPTDTPGDGIYFFRRPRGTKPDGTLDASAGTTAEALATWLAASPAVTVTTEKKVSVGGLAGSQLDVVVAPGVVSHPSDCPVQVCVSLFRGKDPSAKPTWQWDWGSAGPEKQRLYLLSAGDEVVLIAVDSFDGSTFDALTRAADGILRTVKFDRP